MADAQCAQNAGTAEGSVYGGGKKVCGIKRHIIVDTMGLPHAVFVTAANAGDHAGVTEMVGLNPDSLSCVQKFLVDGGYDGEPFANELKKLLGNHVRGEVVSSKAR